MGSAFQSEEQLFSKGAIAQRADACDMQAKSGDGGRAIEGQREAQSNYGAFAAKTQARLDRSVTRFLQWWDTTMHPSHTHDDV